MDIPPFSDIESTRKGCSYLSFVKSIEVSLWHEYSMFWQIV